MQAERTAIAWTRTALSFAANGVLLLTRTLHEAAGPMGFALVAIAFGLAALTAAEGVRRRRALAATRPPPPVTTRPLGLIGGGIVVLAALFVADVLR